MLKTLYEMLIVYGRSMQRSFVMPGFESGGGRATRFRPTLPTAAPTHPPGVKQQPTSHRQTAASRRTSEIRVSLPILICAEHWLLRTSTTLMRRNVRVTVPLMWLRIPARLQRRIGNSRASKSTSLLDCYILVLFACLSTDVKDLRNDIIKGDGIFLRV